MGQISLTIEDAKQLLIDNNLSIKQSILKEKLAQINLTVAKDAQTPSIQFAANNQNTMGLVFDQITGKLITGNQWFNNLNITLSSNIVLFQGFYKTQNIKQEKLNLRISEIETEKLILDIELQMISLFYQTLINKDLYKASLSQKEYSNKQVKQIKTEVDLGRRTIVDLSQAKSKAANDELNSITSKNAYLISIQRLKQILDLLLSDTLELITDNLKIDIDQIQPNFNYNDPYISIISKQLELADIQINIAKTSYYPTLSLNSGYGSNFSSQRVLPSGGKVMPFFDQMFQNRSLFGSLSLIIPIYDGFKTKSNVRKATINKQIISLELSKFEKERLNIFNEVYLDYHAAEEELKAISANYQSNQINYLAILDRFNVGKSLSIELFAALTEFNIAEFKLISAKYNLQFKLSNFDFVK